MTTPRHLEIARSLIGTRETPGPKNNPAIMEWAKEAAEWLGAAYGGDNVAWCGLGVSYCLDAAGFKPPRRGWVGLRARQWEEYGSAVPKDAAFPPLGSIAVFWRKTLASGFGHVGFIVGVYAGGDLAVLGFNQDDEVNIRRFPRSRLTAIRQPPGVAPVPTMLVTGTGRATRSEA